MALEKRPLPELKGQALEDFYDKLETCKVSQSKEEIREIHRWVLEMIDKHRERERREELERLNGQNV